MHHRFAPGAIIGWRYRVVAAIQIARQLWAGIAAAHDRGVLHRDLKPANVMIDGQGDVRITDFGIATAAADVSGEFLGTPQYMAPEQFRGEPASIKTDFYALGLMLFELFTGRRSHERATLEELREFHQSGTYPDPLSPHRLSRVDAWLVGTILALVLALIAIAVVLARRHLRSGRADVAGATTLAIYIGVPRSI